MISVRRGKRKKKQHSPLTVKIMGQVNYGGECELAVLDGCICMPTLLQGTQENSICNAEPHKITWSSSASLTENSWGNVVEFERNCILAVILLWWNLVNILECKMAGAFKQ